MSYTAFTDTETNAGEPVAQELMKKVKTDFDNHETRLLSVEGSSAQLFPIEFDVLGILNPPTAITEAILYRVSAALTVLAIRAIVKTAGSAGTLSVDIERKRGAGAWGSLMTGPITIASAAGNYAVATGVLSATDLLAGDLLRLNINSVQTNMTDFSVYVENKGA